MASIDKFNEHCWKDVIPEADLELYAGWRRETLSGAARAARYRSLRPSVSRRTTFTQRAQCALSQFLRRLRPSRDRSNQAAPRRRAPGRHSDLLLHAGDRPQNRPKGAGSTRQQLAAPPDGYAIYHEFPPQPEDVIITKQRASIFQGTPLFSHLSLLGIQSLIICGESTSGCVRASAVDGYSSGFHVSLVEECTFDRAELTHKVNLFDLHHKYVDVMHLDEVVAHLDTMRMDRAAE